MPAATLPENRVAQLSDALNQLLSSPKSKDLENLLVKALPYENQIRAQRGAAQIARAPEIGAIDETEIDWDDRITRDAIPHGLASMLMGDDNNKKAESVIEYNKFVEALAEAAPAIMEGGDDAEHD